MLICTCIAGRKSVEVAVLLVVYILLKQRRQTAYSLKTPQNSGVFWGTLRKIFLKVQLRNILCKIKKKKKSMFGEKSLELTQHSREARTNSDTRESLSSCTAENVFRFTQLLVDDKHCVQPSKLEFLFIHFH